MAKKGAKGGGTIRKKTVTRSGKEYTYWEARITTGRDPGSGKQIQRSFTGKTQKEVREKMQAAAVEVNQGTYTAPQRMTTGQWLDIWQRNFLGPLKPCTVRTYRGAVRNHICPGLGAVRLVDLRPHMIQEFINGLELAPGSIRLVFQVLHTALGKAVDLDYIPRNPAARCELPRRDRKEIHPLDNGEAVALMAAAKGRSLEHLVTVALFTGLCQSELLGLTWGAEIQFRAGPMWDNPHGLVFTTAQGAPLDQRNVDYQFRRIAAAAGLEHVRFHDTRHTYAVNSIKVDNKDKSENPRFATGWLVCPYSFSINFPTESRHNEGCRKVRCTIRDKENAYYPAGVSVSRLGAFTSREQAGGVSRWGLPQDPPR